MSLELAEKGRHYSFVTGDVIYQTDYSVADPCVWLLLEGEVEITRKYNPIQKESFHYSKGDVIGLLEVYTGTHRLTDAVARTDVRAIGFSRAELEKNMKADLKLGILAIRALSRMLRQINGRIKELH